MFKSNKALIVEIESLCAVLINYSSNIKEKTIENQNLLVLLNCLYDKIENLYININNN